MMSRYRALDSRSPPVAWSSEATCRADVASAVNLFTSWQPNSLCKNNGADSMSGSSLDAPVNSRVSGSAVAKKAASIGISRRNDCSTRRCTSPLSKLRWQCRMISCSAWRALARLGMTTSVPPAVRPGNSQLPGMVAAPRSPQDLAMTSDRIAHNKQLVNDFIQDLFSKGDLSAVDRYLHPHFISHDPPFPGAPDGPEGMRLAAATLRQALPDWHSDVEALIAEGDLVAELFTASGTHQAELMGAPPAGKTLTLRGINIFRIDGDKII